MTLIPIGRILASFVSYYIKIFQISYTINLIQDYVVYSLQAFLNWYKWELLWFQHVRLFGNRGAKKQLIICLLSMVKCCLSVKARHRHFYHSYTFLDFFSARVPTYGCMSLINIWYFSTTLVGTLLVNLLLEYIEVLVLLGIWYLLLQFSYWAHNRNHNLKRFWKLIEDSSLALLCCMIQNTNYSCNVEGKRKYIVLFFYWFVFSLFDQYSKFGFLPLDMFWL